MVGVGEARSDPEAEEIRRGKDRVIEQVDIGAQGFAECQREVMLVVDSGDFGQMRLQRLHAPGFDRGLVHIGVVEVGDFAGVGAGRRAGLRSLFDDGGDVLAAAVGEDRKDADAGAIRGNAVSSAICNCGGALGVERGDGEKGRRKKAGNSCITQHAERRAVHDWELLRQVCENARAAVRLRRRRGMIARENQRCARCAVSLSSSR